MPRKKVTVYSKRTGLPFQVFDYEVKNLVDQGLVSKEAPKKKEQKNTGYTKENKNAPK